MKLGRIIYLALVPVAICILGEAVHAQSAQDCSSLMKFGVYDKFRTLTFSSGQTIRSATGGANVAEDRPRAVTNF